MTNNKLRDYHPEQKQRFSLRKLGTGVASVLLGTTIYLASTNNAQQVKAAALPNDPPQTQVQSQVKSASTDQIADKVDNSDNNVSESTSTDSKNPTNDDLQTDQTADIVPTKPTDGTDDTNKPTDTNNSQIVAKKPKVNVKTNLTKTTINGLTGEYDTTTDTLTISGTTTLTEQTKFFGFFDQYGKTVKHLQIKDKIILKDTAANSLFDGLGSLQDIKGLKNLDTSQVTDMYEMFNDCKSLTSLDLSSFDTSQVTDMYEMFDNCKSLTSLNVSSFDTKQVTNMNTMFYNCKSLTSLDLSSFDTKQVKDMDGMFNFCESLTSLDLSSFDTKQVKDMSYMFGTCKSLTSLDLSGFDTKQVTNMSGMFDGCKALTSLNLSSFDTKQVKNMSNMFWGCSTLTSLDVSNFDTKQVTDMSYMFDYCKSLTSLDLSSFDTSQVTNMYAIFQSCQSLTNIDLSSFDTKQVTNMEYMFYDCPVLNVLKLGPKTYLQRSMDLGHPGFWFKQGAKGTLANPEDKQGRTSKDLVTSYKPDTEADTYIRGYKYQVKFYDKDNNNHIITTAKPIYVILNQYPAGTDVDKGLTIKPTAEINTTIKDLESKNYQVADNPFKPDFTPKPDDTEAAVYFTHKLESTSETVMRTATVYYMDVNETGLKVPHRDLGSFTFMRKGQKDLVNGNIRWDDWSADQTTPTVKNPVISGYVTDKTELEPQTITHAKDLNIYVTYKRLGHVIPVDENGKPLAGVDKIIYENDPNDPTKIKPTLPTIDGYTPSKDAKLPIDPTKDTQIVYLKSNQAMIGFIDQDDNKALHDSIMMTTTIGEAIAKPDAIAQILTDLANKGYELVQDPFKEQVVATAGKQELNYIFKHKNDSSLTDTITRKQIVHFVDSKGHKLADDKVTEVIFTRTGVKNLVTGKITWSEWSKEQVLPKVKIPVVNGYITDKTELSSQTITADKDAETTVTYQQLGSFIPVDKNGKVINGANKVPYANDPDDPTKIKVDQVLPNINGYVTPKVPVPKDATKDTLVYYQPAAVVPSGDDSGHNPVKPTEVPNEPVETPEQPSTPTEKPSKLPIEPVKPTKPHSVKHKPKALKHSKHLGNQGSLTDINQNQQLTPTVNGKQNAVINKHSAAMKQVELPQTGSQTTDKQTALSVIALGVALLSLGLVTKPKTKYE